MESQAASAPPVVRRIRWPNFLQRLAENPVVRKELRGRMRGKQAFLLLTGYLVLISLVIGMVYAGLSSSLPYSGNDIQARQTAGKVIFGTVVLLELFLISFIGPALTSGAISSEREHQTFDLLRTTTLPARSLVMGKLIASLAYLLLLIFAALPIESLAFLLGGVGLVEIVI
ncbi:MAG TPA: ABC transporter permease subunit, partial [Ramlibacter sp.]|nr:ABC transporter permease subunit [Ramlibacter sp.]